MNLLFVCTGLSTGGAEAQLVSLALEHKSRGHVVAVACMIPPAGFATQLRESEIPVYYLGMKRGFPNPLGCLRLARTVRELRPDIVHAHMIHANILSRVARILCYMPVLVCTAHSAYEASSGTRRLKEYSLRELLYTITDPLATVTTQVCQAGAQRYLQVKAVSRERLRVMYNGVDTTRFAPNGTNRDKKRQELGIAGDWLWLAVGRVEQVKGYSLLLQAFAHLRSERSTDKLFIAGVGCLLEPLKRECFKLGLDDAVSFLGMRKDIAELMQAADAFVMSSLFEGLPLVLIEAHAAGLPIVATRVGGNPEVVRDGITGYLCEPDNSRALAQAMRRLRAQDEETRNRMGTAAREHVQRQFSLSSIVPQWERLYSELLQRSLT